jgi:hypothetical protein
MKRDSSIWIDKAAIRGGLGVCLAKMLSRTGKGLALYPKEAVGKVWGQKWKRSSASRKMLV